MATEECVIPDRISELPELVLHCILSFLPVKDAARTSILSKRWSSLWDTLPYLNFGEGFMDPLMISQKKRLNRRQMRKDKILLDIADGIILKRGQQNAGVEKLCVAIPQYHLSILDNPLNYKLERWISCVASSSLRELDLINHGNSLLYLPPSILSAKSLTVLSLCGFSLMLLSSLDIKYPALRKLRFRAVYLDDLILTNLIKSCPLLEDLKLNFVYWIKSIYVNGLPKLKQLEVSNMWHLKTLEIDAPELLDLNVLYVSAEHRFSVKHCACLRKLLLGGEFITEEWLNYFVSQCLFLEKLIVYASSKLENMKISSDTLNTLELIQSKPLVDVEINAPALEKFTFLARSVPTFLLNSSAIREVELNFIPQKVNLGHDKLARFLGYFNHLKSLTLHDLQDKDIIPKAKRDRLPSPLCGTRNLVISVSRKKIAVAALVEYMLWLSPQAETVSITRYPLKDITHAFLKFAYDHGDLSYRCCKFLPIKCWRHCLAEVRIEKFEADEDEMTKMKGFFLEHVKNLKIIDASPASASHCDCDGPSTYFDGLFLEEE